VAERTTTPDDYQAIVYYSEAPGGANAREPR